MAFPLVTLEAGRISQRPFSYGPAKGKSAIGDYWLVPVKTRSLDGGDATRHLLGVDAISVTDASPVVVNAGGSRILSLALRRRASSRPSHRA